MRLNNANYQAIQDDETKDLRLVVRVNFGTRAAPDYVYFNSHDIDIPGAVVYPNTVRDLASYSQKLNPIEARSEIGSASFELVDLNGSVSDLLKAKLAAGKGIRRRFAEIFTGYGGLDWADYRLEQTQVVSQKVAYDDGRYKIQCQDIQREARKDICTPAKTRLAGSVPAVARNGSGEAITASIAVYDTAAFKPNWHGPSYSLTSATLAAGTLASPRGVYIFKIKYQDGWEICVATGKTATSFTNVYRGMFGTAIVAHEIDGAADPQNGPEIEEIIYLELPVLKAIYALLTGKLLGQPHTLDAASGTYKDELPPEWHLGIPEEFVDKDAFLSAGVVLKEDLTDLYKSADDTGFIVRFDNIAKGDGKKFIEKELSLLAGVMLRVAANGQYTLKRMTGVLTDTAYVDVLDETNIVSYSDLTQDLDATHNQFVIDWSYLEFPEAKQFFRSDTLNDLESQSVHGESKPLPLAFKGLHGARHTENTLKTTFNALRDRHSGPPLRLTLELLPSKNNLEVGDIVRVRLPQIRDYTGSTTTLDRSFEVQSVQIDQSSQKIKVELFGSSRKAAPITYSTNYVLPNGWYSTGATLWPQPVSGGISTATVNVPAGTYYYPGDLTINHNVTINGTVFLRVMGTLTVNALIDGKGRSGATGAAYFGTTEPTGKVLWYLKSGKRKVTSTRGTVYKGQTDTLPQLNIGNNAGVLTGLPAALNGSKGAQGGEGVSHVTGNAYNTTPGGAGGNGGAGLGLVVRNLVFGAGGRIDTSGTDGANGAMQSTVVYSGSGAGGAPGAVLVLFDGTPPVPVWNGKIDCWYGDCNLALGKRPSAPVIKYSSSSSAWHSYYEGRPKENVWVSAFRWGYVPQSQTAYPDYRLSLSGGNVTFSQAAEPTNADCQRLVRRDLIVNDLWIETDAGNKLRRWDGSAWADASDADIAVAIATANSAAAEAANAQADATASLSMLSDIGADGKLTPAEKQDAVREFADLTNEKAGIEAQATAFGVTTEKTNYTNSYNALSAYLGGLSPNWNDTSTTTSISRTIWRSNWADVYTKRQAVLNKIAEIAAQRANWTGLNGRPSDSQLLNNILDTSTWTVGASGTQGRFTQLGISAENTVQLLAGPYGNTEPVWRAGTDAASDGDGGWNYTFSTADGFDPKKTYRFIVWIKQTNTNGTVYLGCIDNGDTLNLSGTVAGNPYFWTGDLLENNKWFLVVGVLHGSDYAGADTGIAGVYDPATGQKVLDATEYKSAPGATQQRHRAYLYYSTDLANYAYFARPRVEEMNGNEQPIASILSPAALAIAASAQSAAEAAQADATSSLADLADIGTDGKLHKSEKKVAIREYNDLINEQSGIGARADGYNITTEKTAYNTAVTALTTYLNGLSPAWNSTTSTTSITRTTWNQKWNDVYTARQALLNKIAQVAGERAEWATVNGRPTTLYALDARSAAIIETRTEGVLFSETFSDPNAIDQWQEYNGGVGEMSLTTDAEVTNGGKVLAVGNNSGNDMVWRLHRATLPFNPAKLYRIRARVKRTAGTGKVYIGVAGVAANETTLVNTAGANSSSSQHYFGGAGLDPGTAFQEYIGYFKGHSASPGGATPTWNAPGALHANVRFIRPLFIANYDGVAGRTVIDYIKIEEVQLDAQGRPTELYNGDQNATADISLVAGSNVYVTGNRIVKYTAGGSWNASCYSKESYTGGAYVSFSPEQNTAAIMVGLNSDPTTDESFASIDYAMYCRTDGTLYAYINGGNQGQKGTYVAGDVLAVSYDGVRVRWLKNGAVIFSAVASANLQLYMDSSFSSVGAVAGVRFGPLTSNNWADIGGTGRPEDNATFGADFGTNVTNRFANWLARNSGDGTSLETIISRINNTGRAVSTRFLRASNAWGNTISKSSYTTLTSVYTAGTSRIDIAAFNATYDYGTYAYPSGQITGLLTGTLYYIYAIDPNGDGTGVSYAATRTFTDTTASPDRAYVGKITTATSGGGGSPPDECVVVSMWVGTGKRAGEVAVGDDLVTLADGGDNVGLYPCRANRVTLADCVRITTASGCWVECSIDTPVTLRSGDTVLAPNVRGCKVAVLDRGEYRWEPVASVEFIGQQWVAHISVDDGTYAAGGEPDRLVFTHNATQKP